MKNRTQHVLATVSLGLILLGANPVILHAGGSESDEDDGRVVWGTWVLALDATPFGIPGGFLPGTVTIHRDRTLTTADGGDIGSFPFTTTDTPQHGVWAMVDQRTFKATTLFLRKDEITGQLEGWHRVNITLQFGEDANQLVGFAEEEVLLTDPSSPTPFPLLNAPDPITSDFIPSPFAIPIELKRLQVR